MDQPEFSRLVKYKSTSSENYQRKMYNLYIKRKKYNMTIACKNWLHTIVSAAYNNLTYIFIHFFWRIWFFCSFFFACFFCWRFLILWAWCWPYTWCWLVQHTLTHALGNTHSMRRVFVHDNHAKCKREQTWISKVPEKRIHGQRLARCMASTLLYSRNLKTQHIYILPTLY